MLSSSQRTACFKPPLRSDRRGGFVGSNESGALSRLISIWREGRADLLVALAVAVLVLLAYSNHFQNGFQFDDAHTVVNNAFIQDVRNIPQFFRDGTTFSSLPSNQSYRPLVSTLLAISYALAGGLKPFWFHFVIFALFLLEVLLLGYVLGQVFDRFSPSRANRWIAAIAACWYGGARGLAERLRHSVATDKAANGYKRCALGKVDAWLRSVRKRSLGDS